MKISPLEFLVTGTRAQEPVGHHRLAPEPVRLKTDRWNTLLTTLALSARLFAVVCQIAKKIKYRILCEKNFYLKKYQKNLLI
jgi:hypothetical protein